MMTLLIYTLYIRVSSPFFLHISCTLDELLNIDNSYFEGMVTKIYASELQLNKTNFTDTNTAFLDLHLLISNGFVSSKMPDKHVDFDFDIVNFLFSFFFFFFFFFFLMGTFLVSLLMVFIFLNLLGLQECLVILTSMLVTKL